MAAFIRLVSHSGPVPASLAREPAPDPAQFGLPDGDDGSRDDVLLEQNMLTCTLHEHDGDALRAWVTGCADELGGIDVVVANVSALAIPPTEENWEASFRTDMLGTVRLVEAALPSLVRDQVQVRQVDGGHHERHQGVAAVVLGVGEDGEVGLVELLLCRARATSGKGLF